MTSNLTVKLGVDIAELQKGLQKAQGSLTTFQKNIGGIGASIAAAFGVQQVASFALEVSKLAGQAEGVRAAFERLPNSTKLMLELKEATGNTVSELELMKRAVQANNFEISLKALPRLLEFATLRAQQTGQSVDYLVDSIVTGIGRKSKLILDNLGISAVQLDEALGGASAAASTIGEVADAVGRIAEKNLTNMATFSENASTKLQRLDASWVNLRVSIGDAANGTGILGTALDYVNRAMETLGSKSVSFLDLFTLAMGSPAGVMAARAKDIEERTRAIAEESKKQAQVIKEVDHAFKEFNGNIEAYGNAITTHIYRTELLAEFQKRLVDSTNDHGRTIESLKSELDELNGTFATTNINDQTKLKNIGDQIIALEAQIKKLEELKKAQDGANSTASLQQQRGSTTTLAGGGNVDLLKSEGLDPEYIDSQLTKASDSIDKFKSKVGEAQVQVLEFAPAVSGAITQMADGLGRALVGAADFGEVILDVIAGFMSELGASLIAIGTGMLAAQAAITNPYTAIAAGFALVALSGAMAAATSKAQSNFNSGGAGGSGSLGSPSNSSNVDENMEIRLGGEIRIDGNDLVYVINRTNQKNGRTG